MKSSTESKSQLPQEKKPTIKLEKYETTPDAGTSNYLLFSMHEVGDATSKLDGSIFSYLKSFPKMNITLSELPSVEEEYDEKFYEKNPTKKNPGCAATLVWSGTEGHNIPIPSFVSSPYGFILNPHLIDVPQADFVAQQSGSLLTKEIKKSETGKSTKYPDKVGYMRVSFLDRHSADEKYFFTTNAAKNQHTLGKERKSTSALEGRVDIFAGNVWRKYFKHSFDRMNEAIVFQKKETTTNPIDGLFITKYFEVKNIYEKKDISKLKTILTKNPSLKLYFYDVEANEHIVRYLDNQSAQQFLTDKLSDKVNFTQAFKTATPFRGFTPPQPSSLLKTEKPKFKIWYNKLPTWGKLLFCIGVPLVISAVAFLIGTGIGAVILGVSFTTALIIGGSTLGGIAGVSASAGGAGAIVSAAAFDTVAASTLISTSTAIHLQLNSKPDLSTKAVEDDKSPSKTSDRTSSKTRNSIITQRKPSK